MTPHFLGPLHDPQRFLVTSRLGRGGMGVVYAARALRSGGRVAVKTLPPGELCYLANLEREHRWLRHLRHPNLVRLVDLFQAEETWALVMELVEGEHYLSWVRGVSPEADAADGNDESTVTAELSAPTIAQASSAPVATGVSLGQGAMASDAALVRLGTSLPQLGAALRTLHAEGLVHCDVKPTNLLVTSTGRVVLLDFGLVRRAGEPRAERLCAGTPAFMAPEQAGEGAVTGAADCYAVGVILYQAITGRLPFVGAIRDLLHRKANWSPVAPRLLRPGVPRALEELCLALLSPSPADRPDASAIASWSHGAAREQERLVLSENRLSRIG